MAACGQCEKSQRSSPVRSGVDTDRSTHVVSSELKDGPAEASLNILAHLPSASLGTSERDEVDPLVINDSLSSLTATAEKRRESSREVVLLEYRGNDLGGGDGAEGSGRGGLPDGGVSADERERKVPSVDSRREVEGGDLSGQRWEGQRRFVVASLSPSIGRER